MKMTIPSFLRRGLRGGSEASGGWLTYGRHEISTYKTVKTVMLLWIPLFKHRLKSGAIETDSISQTILMVFFTAVASFRTNKLEGVKW